MANQQNLGFINISHLLLWYHSGKHLDVRYEPQQLLSVQSLQVRETFSCHTEVVVLRQLHYRSPRLANPFEPPFKYKSPQFSS